MVPPKQQQERKKQFSARSHSRSASYGRNLNRLGRIRSTEDINQRPTLNRSISTDGTLAKKNRSLTKLTGLQPLSRTRSHQPVQRNGKAVLELHKEPGSSDDENADTDKKSDEGSEEEVDEFSDEEQIPTNEKPSQVQLSYKAPAQFNHASVTKVSCSASESTDPHKSEKQKQPQNTASQDKIENSLKLDATRLEREASKLNLNDLSDKTESLSEPKEQQQADVNQYRENMSEYYQNVILSESTGAIRAFNDQPFMNSLVQDQITQGNHPKALQYIHSNDHISGALGNLKTTSSSSNSLRQFTMQNQASAHNSSNESSSILSFRAREPAGITMTPANNSSNKGNRDSASGTPNSFSQFLKGNNLNIETRTQQKLWLQRENSLMDLPSASGNNTNNPQLRRDFERISREFVNVRRFSNPCVESTKRLTTATPKPLNGNGPVSLSNTKYIENIQSNDFQAKLYKLWVDGDSAGNRGLNQLTMKPNQNQQHQTLLQLKQQQLLAQRLPPLQTANSSYNVNNSLRSPATPTTRAVDRANNSPENKRIDLGAIRLPEEHVQKLS